MITMGDEVGRTQIGSNNAYSLPAGKTADELHDEASFNGGWALSWKYNDHQIDMLETTISLIKFRKNYLMPVARMFFTGELDLNTSRRDLAWFSRAGHEMSQADWDKLDNRNLMMYVEADEDRGLLMMFNGSIIQKEFTLPGEQLGDAYRSVFDSAENVLHYSPRIAAPGSKVILQAHALQVWLVNRESVTK
jgi:glycogen operon protein